MTDKLLCSFLTLHNKLKKAWNLKERKDGGLSLLYARKSPLKIPCVECACVKYLQGGFWDMFWVRKCIVPMFLQRRWWKCLFVCPHPLWEGAIRHTSGYVEQITYCTVHLRIPNTLENLHLI